MRHLGFSFLLAVLLYGCAATQPHPSPSVAERATPAPAVQWFKGNTHTHTNKSDGDTTPALVARWYRDHDYDFLVLTDHASQTPIDGLQREIAAENETAKKKPFLLIPGEENGAKVKTTDRPRAVHVVAIGTARTVGVQNGETVPDGIQQCVDAIHAAGGLAHIDHPNFMWSLTADDLFVAQNVNHFEVYNAHPGVNNLGGGGQPGTEEIWDNLLSRGRLYYGIADDDAHRFQKWGPEQANPGRGWIVVRATELTAPAVLDAIGRGDYYASSGVMLDDVSMADRTLRLKIHQRGDFLYRTQFIGKNGKVLAVDETLTPSYRLKRGDLYVRARVTSSGGQYAWSQPLFAPGAYAK